MILFFSHLVVSLHTPVETLTCTDLLLKLYALLLCGLCVVGTACF